MGGTSRGWPTGTTDERARGELEEDEEEERLLARSGMSEYYGSEGFDHPPSGVYSYGGGFFGDVGAARGVSAFALLRDLEQIRCWARPRRSFSPL